MLRKLTTLLLMHLALFIFISQSAFSAELITNPQLKEWIKRNANKLSGVVVNEDGGIDSTTANLEALAKIDSLECIHSFSLVTIDELIRNMPNLKTLLCYRNALIELDVSKNTKLKKLHCYENKLNNLDMSNNIELTELKCSDNQLTNLNISHNIELIELKCNHNQLTSLDISKNIKLKDLHCFDNQLTNLDVTNNIDLGQLGCFNNPLTNLDVSKNINLYSLYCYNNQLTNLDISKNIRLFSLFCSENQLSNLDISKNTRLCWFDCSKNQLNYLDVTKHIELQRLFCNDNMLDSLDISPLTKLKELNCCNQAQGFILYYINKQMYEQKGKYIITKFNEGNYCDAILKERQKSICELEWLDIHPNPTAGKFFIDSKFLSDEIKILNLAGEVLYKNTLNSEKTEIDISNLPAGVYFVITKGKIGKVVKN